MVGAAGGVEADVGPVAEVAVAPDGDGCRGADMRLEGVGTREGFEDEGGRLGGSSGDVVGEGGDAVVAVFVVAVAEEKGL